MARRLSTYWPFALLGAVWLAFVAYAWPGCLTWDSINQLLQARSGQYGDWHPPLMALIWGWLDALVPGPALMLVLQTILFVGGIYLFVRRYTRTARSAALIATAVFLFPPVFTPFSAVWKDCLMAGVLLCGIAGISARPRAAQAAGWLAFAVAAGLRHNAPIVIVPLTMMIAPYRPAWSAWRRRALGAALGLAICVVGVGIDRALVRVEEYPFPNMIAIGDLAGAIAREGPMTDAEIRDLVAGTPLRATDDLQTKIRTLIGNDGSYEAVALGDARVWDVATTPEQAAAYVHAWRRLIVEHTGAYLTYRAELFRQLLGLTDLPIAQFVVPGDGNAHLLAMVGEAPTANSYQRHVGHWLKKLKHTGLFWPLLYVVLGAGLLVLMWRDLLLRGLLGGALANVAALFVISPGGAEYRYVHWLVVCCALAAAVRFIRSAQARDPVGEVAG